MAFTLLSYKNYLSLINGLPESTMFQHAYANNEDGVEIDIMQGGEVSCAYVVSSILTIIGWFDRPHATVKSTLATLKQKGWQETHQPVPGAIVLWPESKDGHEHVGFYLGDDICISNSTADCVPKRHGKKLIDGREPVMYLISENLK